MYEQRETAEIRICIFLNSKRIVRGGKKRQELIGNKFR
jgi:hypothetical protein